MKSYLTYSISHTTELQNDIASISTSLSRHADIDLTVKEPSTSKPSIVDKVIRTSDFMIANLTYSSSAVGFEVAMALHLNKPVLIMYRSGTTPPSLLADIESELVMCEAYTQQSINENVDLFIQFAKSHMETRFTFFITPSIAAHLGKMALRYRMPKSVYLRRLIEEDMASHTSR